MQSHVTMVKKQLRNGEACRKCIEAEQMLKQRGLWENVDEVVWAIEGDPESPGARLGRARHVETAPFFLVRAEEPGSDDTAREGATSEPHQHDAEVFTSVLKFIRATVDKNARRNESARTRGTGGSEAPQALVQRAARELAKASPVDILRWGLQRHGAKCAIAFSGAEDVALIDMAARTDLPFSVFCLDTGRLHPETYRFIDDVRKHYGVEIDLRSPEPASLQPFVRKKGLFSFYEDGHGECCSVRKVAPLKQALRGYDAWAVGLRRDQNPGTRGDIPVVQLDGAFQGRGEHLIKLNPVAEWSSADTWNYIRENDVPYNPLHEKGFVSIGCEPCTRAVLPGQHEREGRWWWEQESTKECGLHGSNVARKH